MFKTPEHLHYLNSVLTSRGVTAYLTGGFIRNTLLGFEVHDVDICASAVPSEIESLLAGTEISVISVAPDFGTVLLCYSFGAEQYKIEYTTFRCDSYPRGGAHRPESVVFTKDMGIDAARRDFTINAMYCPLDGGNILDPTGGLDDLEKRLLRATSIPPQEVMRQDGLRILRLARQACSMGLTIEPDTFMAAREMHENIRGIAPERIMVELNKILLADTAYGISNAHITGLDMLRELRVLKIILPELWAGDTGLCKNAPPELSLRLASLMRNIPVKDVKKRLNSLTFPQKTIRRVCALIENYPLITNINIPEDALRLELARLGPELVEQLMALWNADGLDSSRWEALLNTMLAENTPFALSELDINGNDIINAFHPSGREIGEAMRFLWEKAIVSPNINNKKLLLFMLRDYFNTP